MAVNKLSVYDVFLVDVLQEILTLAFDMSTIFLSVLLLMQGQLKGMREYHFHRQVMEKRSHFHLHDFEVNCARKKKKILSSI